MHCSHIDGKQEIMQQSIVMIFLAMWLIEQPLNKHYFYYMNGSAVCRRNVKERLI
jgi:hypothetical protein